MMPEAKVETGFARFRGTVAVLAGLGAIVGLLLARAVLDPGRTTAQPPSPLTATTLSSSLALTDGAAVRLSAYVAIAAVVLFVVFSIQLSARLGTERGTRPTASVVVIVLGAILATLLAVDWGFALAFGEVAIARDLEDVLTSYFVWGWWQGQVVGALLVCQMGVVAACGLHGIAAAGPARWSTLVLGALLAVVTVQGLGGLGLLAGGAWIAALSVAMAIERAVGSPGDEGSGDLGPAATDR